MKKNIILIITAVLIIMAIICYNYWTYNRNKLEVQNNNKTYESFYNVEVLGTDIASLINKVDDSNSKNNVSKDDNGFYIENEKNSIKIEIKFLEMDKIISSDAVIKNGIEKFVQNFATMSFKCSKIEYHQSTKLVKYMYFEQV